MIKTWDWRYRLNFSNDIKEEVNDFISTLNSREKEIYKEIVDFYMKFISFDLLLEYIEEANENDQIELIKEAYKNKEKYLKIPILLESTYAMQIETMNLSLINELLLLLDYLVDDSCHSCIEVYKKIFGAYYEDILILMNIKDNKITTTNKIYKQSELDYKLNEVLEKVSKNMVVTSNYGENLANEFNVTKQTRQGFAEYWPTILTDLEKDELMLFINSDALNKDDFEYTIYHEVYPGHGHFFNYFKELKSMDIDYGSFALVEGWATYAEWNVNDNDYAKSLKEKAKEFLRISLDDKLSLNDKSGQIYNWCLLNGQTKEQAIHMLKRYSQYPGFQEYYYLGALCMAVMIEKKVINKPIDLLELIKYRSKGDLFGEWR